MRIESDATEKRDLAMVYGLLALWLACGAASFGFFVWMSEPAPVRADITILKAKPVPVLISGPTEVVR